MSERQTYTGTITSMRRDRKGVKMEDGNWYSVFTAQQLADVEYKDTVTFTYEVKPSNNGGGVFRNIKGDVRKAAPGTPSTAPAASSTGSAQNHVSGVELGHAMNVATEIVTTMYVSAEVMGHIQTPDDMLKEIARVSENVYATTKAMRESPEFGSKPKFNFSNPTATAAPETPYVRAEVPRVNPEPETAPAAVFPGDL